ncbi:MAG: LuxR C-terminal-related transcriptional regulator [Capsulimonadaceae bacterium]|nr:LuxR C-terminal-related transcriptional regulator [Capsulimonadaceae bacterium]
MVYSLAEQGDVFNQKVVNADTVIEVDRILRSLAEHEFDEIGRLLQNTAEIFMPVDSCYLCMWDEDSKMLRFTYNYDVEATWGVDFPCVAPLGNGPSSYVVRNKTSYVLNSPDRSVQDAGMTFGDTCRTSASALHVPVAADTGLDNLLILGVFSVQSYTANAYDSQDLRFVEWLGRSAGQAMLSKRRSAVHEATTAEIKQLKDELSVREISLVNSFITLFREIDVAINALIESPPATCHMVKESLTALAKISQRVQAKATCLRFSTPGIRQAEYDFEARLTERERELLPYFASGMTYKEIGSHLNISVNTVKFHLGNILTHLGIQSRSQIPMRLSEAQSRMLKLPK